MPTQLEFLKSVRFWKLVIAGVAFALYQDGVVSQAVLSLVETILLGSVAVRTVDRFGEKLGNK